LRRAQWVVYAKPPFGGPLQVLQYLARYTHRVAISNRRLQKLENGQVSFEWKDYRVKEPAQQIQTMTVAAEEFIRRFLQHSVPTGLQRIRYYGFLANCHRTAMLELCRQLLATPSSALLPNLPAAIAEAQPRSCPLCGRILVRMAIPPCRPLDTS
jgi:hypothetical protein